MSSRCLESSAEFLDAPVEAAVESPWITAEVFPKPRAAEAVA